MRCSFGHPDRVLRIGALQDGIAESPQTLLGDDEVVITDYQNRLGCVARCRLSAVLEPALPEPDVHTLPYRARRRPHRHDQGAAG
jgi:hypothetical protein